MSFLNAHRDTILGLLRDPVGKIPLSTIKELHLLATIFTQVLPTVESQDLGLSSGFGAYHNALLHLASRFFLREKWEDLTVPLNDAERADAEKPAPSGKQNGSLFDYNTDNAVEDLNASLLSYFVLATETRGSAPLRPVFTPSVSTRETGLLPKGAFLTPPPLLISLSASDPCFFPFLRWWAFGPVGRRPPLRNRLVPAHDRRPVRERVGQDCPAQDAHQRRD